MSEKEKKLVLAVLQGNMAATRQMYGLVEARLMTFFESKTECVEDAEELTQDTFLHLLDALPLFRFQSSLTTFVMGIARHELMDYWRKKYAKRAIKIISGLEVLTKTIDESEQVSVKIHEALEQAFAKLKPLQAKLLRMKYEEGKSVKEIAVRLGWSIKAVEAQLYRSRKAFQKVYMPAEEMY